MHTHELTHACLVLDGEMIDRQWEARATPATTGALLINPPHTNHEIEAGTEGLVCLVIEWDFGVAVSDVQRRSVTPALESVRQNLTQLNAFNPAKKMLAERRIAASIKRAVREEDDAPASWLVEARAALEDPESETAVREIAKRAGVHRATLSKQFHELFGVSPEQYRIMMKLDRAADLLVAGGRLAEAAATAGFADQAHLTRAWRKKFGAPPKQWLRSRATIVQ